MNSVEFLDAVRQKHDVPSYNKLATFLDIPQGRISQYTTGKRKLDPKACEKVAAALDVDPGYVMASIQAERAKRTDEREVWLRLARLAKKSKAAAAVALLAMTGFSMQPADASVLYPAQDGARTMYIMLNSIYVLNGVMAATSSWCHTTQYQVLNWQETQPHSWNTMSGQL